MNRSRLLGAFAALLFLSTEPTLAYWSLAERIPLVWRDAGLARNPLAAWSLCGGPSVWRTATDHELSFLRCDSKFRAAVLRDNLSVAAWAAPPTVLDGLPDHTVDIATNHVLPPSGDPTAKRICVKNVSRLREVIVGLAMADDCSSVIDKVTGLEWLASDNGVALDWVGANDYCSHHRQDGRQPWRLPKRGELQTLYSRVQILGHSVVECSSPTEVYEANEYNWTGFSAAVIPGVQTSCFAFWASDTAPDNQATVVDFGDGTTYLRPRASSAYLRALCVRGTG